MKSKFFKIFGIVLLVVMSAFFSAIVSASLNPQQTVEKCYKVYNCWGAYEKITVCKIGTDGHCTGTKEVRADPIPPIDLCK